MPTLTSFQSIFVAELQATEVPFLVIGGKAIQAHGIERLTQDLDILVSRIGTHSDKLLPLVAKRMARTSPKLTAEMVRLPQKRVCLPDTQDNEVDILTSIGALDFELAAEMSVVISFGEVSLKVLGLEELIYSKAVAASKNEAPETRRRDREDLQKLLALWESRRVQ